MRWCLCSYILSPPPLPKLGVFIAIVWKGPKFLMETALVSFREGEHFVRGKKKGNVSEKAPQLLRTSLISARAWNCMASPIPSRDYKYVHARKMRQSRGNKDESASMYTIPPPPLSDSPPAIFRGFDAREHGSRRVNPSIAAPAATQ